MPTAEKQQAVEDLARQLEGVKGLYLADFTGMDVERMTLLRKQCRESSIQFKVIKNTLIRRAMDRHGITALDDFLEGPTGLAFSAVDQVAPARILADFAKKHEVPRIKAAYVDGKLFDEKQVKRLAALPSRQQLLGQLLGTLVAPLTQFLAAVDATLRLPAVMADVLAREKQRG